MIKNGHSTRISVITLYQYVSRTSQPKILAKNRTILQALTYRNYPVDPRGKSHGNPTKAPGTCRKRLREFHWDLKGQSDGKPAGNTIGTLRQLYTRRELHGHQARTVRRTVLEHCGGNCAGTCAGCAIFMGTSA